MKKPKSKNLGKFIIETDGKDYYVVLPNGLIKIFSTIAGAEDCILTFVHGKRIGHAFVTIEWRCE